MQNNNLCENNVIRHNSNGKDFPDNNSFNNTNYDTFNVSTSKNPVVDYKYYCGFLYHLL